uniref:Uncharacterized protein n=1 Tax=Ralstonia solanacearum TaxID=305 RepID=A0A0S4WU86_RALSL|nr:protein of unknown function [Ralstonia solanacearum]
MYAYSPSRRSLIRGLCGTFDQLGKRRFFGSFQVSSLIRNLAILKYENALCLI